ncbi:hypothetical protein H2200_003622 [Cladophialophora chaetospira]|uniref:Nucleoporin NUP53 n=1 Tax=Cladophialophora chaetospira TaxID=386627 RepID=A0AA38XES3_9EURO|nr:hypothetical protein H2200_003622 [Cladophialophora chaetospira]
MEIHSVLPEERARDTKGDTLPWGYRYADSSRNARQQIEESGPFGRNRSIRSTASRTPRARTGTTPVRQKENSAVAEFGRLFAKEQAEEERRKPASKPLSADEAAAAERPIQPEAVPTECLLYGYAGKQTEWKVLSKFEKIVFPGIICEDYPREDPNLFLSSNSPLAFSRASVVVHQNLSREAIKKSRIYYGGNHWIKVTFDSYQAAERACFYSPIDIDGYSVHCEMWQGKGPAVDASIPSGWGQDKADLIQPQLSPRKLDNGRRPRTLSSSQGARALSGKDSTMAGFERALQTLPRSHSLPDVQYGQPDDDLSFNSTTASSATATGLDVAPQPQQPLIPSTPHGLRSRSVPQLPSQDLSLRTPTSSEYMTHITSVKKARLRPISEALPPQPTFLDRVLRSIPIVSYFATPAVSSTLSGSTPAGLVTQKRGDVIGEGPLLKDDGSWDPANGWYWRFWGGVDSWFGTDFCGLKDD